MTGPSRPASRLSPPVLLLLAVPLVLCGMPDLSAQAPAAATTEAETLTRAKELVREGGYAEAAGLLDEIEDSYAEDPDFLSLYGEVLVASSEPAKAAAVLERAIEAAPDRPRLHFQLGTARSSLGEVDAALEAFAREIELTEDPHVRFLSHMNRSILLRGRPRSRLEAAGELGKALEIEAGHPEAWGEMAALYLDAGRPEEAAAALDRGSEFGFRSAQLHFNLGARLYNDQRFAEAEKAFRQALAVSPDMAEAERGLGMTLSQMGRDEEALERLARYLELEPEASDAEEIRERLSAAGR